MLPEPIRLLLSAFASGDLSPRRRAAAVRLLRHSSEARKLLRQLKLDRKRVRYLPQLRLPEGFADRIARLWLRREATRYPLFAEGYGIVTGAVRGVIIALGLLMFLESVGISIGPLLASLGIGSLAIALALQETVKNMFSGFFLIADQVDFIGFVIR